MKTSMKTQATLLLAALTAVACGGARPLAATPTLDARGPTELQVAVASDDFAVGQPRVPFVIFAGPERVNDAQRVGLIAFELGAATPVPGWRGEAVNYSDYEVPYWVAHPDLPHAGYWGLGLEITQADGSLTHAEFAIEVAEHSSSPAVGSRPPPLENRTLHTETDIHKLTSGVAPVPGLYQMTVAEAMASGRPTVVTFATPAYCVSRLCAPVVNSVEQVYQTLGEQANFIHIEVYKSFDPLVYADEMEAWKLTSEPWTFVLDSDGTVAARLAGPVSPRELTAALEPLLPSQDGL